MPKVGKLFENAVESSGSSFKEGWVRISEEPEFRVHQNKGGEGREQPAPILAFILKGTRLDEDFDALKSDAGEELTEELVFGLGGKSLAKMHPGTATSADDDDPEDEGTEINASGNTIYVAESVGADLLNKKSSYYKLLDSLKKLGEKDEIIDAHYAPLWKGAVLYFHAQPDNDVMVKDNRTGKDVAVNYKVVKEVHTSLGGGSKKAKGGAKEAPADKKKATKGGGDEDDNSAMLVKALKEVAKTHDAEKLSMKIVSGEVSNKLDDLKVDTKSQIALLNAFRTKEWHDNNPVPGVTVTEKDGKMVFEFE